MSLIQKRVENRGIYVVKLCCDWVADKYNNGVIVVYIYTGIRQCWLHLL